MSYNQFLKIWAKYNVSSRENIRYDLLKLIPMIGIAPALFRVHDSGKVTLILISLLGLVFIEVIRIRPPKMLYILPVDDAGRKKYVQRAFWTRFAIPELLYVVVSIIYVLIDMISLSYFIAGNIGMLLMTICINESRVIQIDRVPSKLNTEMDNMFYSVGERAYEIGATLCGMVFQLMIFSKEVGEDHFGIEMTLFTWLFLGTLATICFGISIGIHCKKHGGRVTLAASYETIVNVKKSLSIA